MPSSKHIRDKDRLVMMSPVCGVCFGFGRPDRRSGWFVTAQGARDHRTARDTPADEEQLPARQRLRLNYPAKFNAEVAL